MGCRWAQSVPQPPSKELKDTLYNAAFHDGAHGLHASTGMAIVTAGDQRTTILKRLQAPVGLTMTASGLCSTH